MTDDTSKKPLNQGHYAPAGWITRAEVAKMLGCVYRTVIILEKRGKLHPKESTDGVVCFDPREIVDFRKSWQPANGHAKGISHAKVNDGWREAAITEMLRKKKTSADIVVTLKVTYDLVHTVARKMLEDPFSDTYLTDSEREQSLKVWAQVECERERTQRAAILQASKATPMKRKKDGRAFTSAANGQHNKTGRI